MKGGARLGVVAAVLLTGCLSTGPATENSTPKEAENMVAGAQDDQDNTTYLMDFNLRMPSDPVLGKPEQTKVTLGGNYTVMRITTTFYQNQVLIADSNLAGQEPAIRATWADGTTLVAHTMRGGTFVLAGNPTQYVRHSTQETLVTAPAEPIEATFKTIGWGDIFARIGIDIVNQPGSKLET